mmetsp:Transcript_8240/g.15997  ORF Transcript_8240/g.15997 Transcript_8240/m.15997 type:complete len:92 (-) Transcript_8240:1067-1342(-)
MHHAIRMARGKGDYATRAIRTQGATARCDAYEEKVPTANAGKEASAAVPVADTPPAPLPSMSSEAGGDVDLTSLRGIPPGSIGCRFVAGWS